MLSSKNVMTNLFEFAGKKFNHDIISMTNYVMEMFDKANLMHHIENSQNPNDINLTYNEVCRLAEISKIPLEKLMK